MKAHRTDLVSFSFGLVFLALSVWWLLARILGLAIPPVGWFLASALILVGVLGLVGALRSGRHADRDVPAATPEPEATVPAPYEGGTGWTPAASAEADEWRTDAVADEAEAAVTDRPVSGGTGARWSAATPAADAATREQPTVEVGPSAGEEPTEAVGVGTREQPTVDLAPTTREQPPVAAGGSDQAPADRRRGGGDGPAPGPDGEERSPA